MTRILVTARSGHSVTLLSELATWTDIVVGVVGSPEFELAELLQASASFDADNLSEVTT